ncbi:MAG: hypothetical protein NZL83_02400 [Candidatus Absconditabacterales bacterium]|nr:hypothetical protein [Candidatus Absconditabacterales bacterium]
MKQLLRESVSFLFNYPVLVRLTFFLGGIMSLYSIFSVLIKINNVAHFKYELTEGTFVYVNMVIDFFLSQGLASVLFIILIIAFVGYVILYPLSVGFGILYLDTGKLTMSKGFDTYFPVVVMSSVLSFLTFGSWHIQLVLWLYIMDVLFDPFVLVIVGIVFVVVVFSSIFLPFSLYFLLLEHDGGGLENEAWNAMQKSARLVLDNFGTTIAYSLFQMVLQMRYVLNILLVVGLPISLVYLSVEYQLVSFEFAMWFAVGLASVILLFVMYVDAVLDALFMTYRYKLFIIFTGRLPARDVIPWQLTKQMRNQEVQTVESDTSPSD